MHIALSEIRTRQGSNGGQAMRPHLAVSLKIGSAREGPMMPFQSPGLRPEARPLDLGNVPASPEGRYP